ASIDGNRLALGGAERVHEGHRYTLAVAPVRVKYFVLQSERRFRSRRAGHRGLRTWIPAPQRIPANHENVQKHLDTVAPHAHFSGRRMRPAHRNFHRAQAVMPRQVQELRIKAEALDALLLEDHAAAFTAKGLEAALCIDKGQTEDGAHDKIEND